MSPALLAIACLLAITLGYVAKCAVSPFGDCRTCQGIGQIVAIGRNGKPKAKRPCRRCKTTGKRIRVGRWIYNRLATTYRNGTR
jgi:DnaJ-class molecular chaperone